EVLLLPDRSRSLPYGYNPRRDIRRNQISSADRLCHHDPCNELALHSLNSTIPGILVWLLEQSRLSYRQAADVHSLVPLVVAIANDWHLIHL
nr:hypothetical protein [Tanacetum cinerariifolium]